MAGDWIKVRTTLGTEQATMVICDRTGLDEFAVVGRLHAVWVWAGEHTVTGVIRGVTLKTIDRIARCENFGDAMVSVGWLSVVNSEADSAEQNGVKFPRWQRWNNKSSKKRHLAAIRSARHRAKKARDSSRAERDGVTQKKAKRHANHAPREEKRRVDITPPTSPTLAEAERERLVEVVAKQGVHEAAGAVDRALARGCSAMQIEEAARVTNGKALFTLIETLKPTPAVVKAKRAAESREERRLRIIRENDIAGISRAATNQQLISDGLEGVFVPETNGSAI